MWSHSKCMCKWQLTSFLRFSYLETSDPFQVCLDSSDRYMADSNWHVVTSLEWTRGEQKTWVNVPATT